MIFLEKNNFLNSFKKIFFNRLSKNYKLLKNFLNLYIKNLYKTEYILNFENTKDFFLHICNKRKKKLIYKL